MHNALTLVSLVIKISEIPIVKLPIILANSFEFNPLSQVVFFHAFPLSGGGGGAP